MRQSVLWFVDSQALRRDLRHPAFTEDLKKNIIPIWEAEKSAGLIVSYELFLNSTSSGPDDWDIGYSLTYKNMAALDGLPDKVYELRMKQ